MIDSLVMMMVLFQFCFYPYILSFSRGNLVWLVISNESLSHIIVYTSTLISLSLSISHVHVFSLFPSIFILLSLDCMCPESFQFKALVFILNNYFICRKHVCCRKKLLKRRGRHGLNVLRQAMRVQICLLNSFSQISTEHNFISYIDTEVCERDDSL